MIRTHAPHTIEEWWCTRYGRGGAVPDGCASGRRSRGRGPADHRSKSRKDALHTLQIQKKTPTGTSPLSPRSVSALSLLSVLPQLQALCHCDEALRLRSIHSCTPNNARVSTKFRKHTVTFIILCVPLFHCQHARSGF